MVSDTSPNRNGLKRFARSAGIALIGLGASSQYMTTGKMPAWKPEPTEGMKRFGERISYLASEQTKPYKPQSTLLDKMALKEHSEHPWLSYDQARRVASDHLHERREQKRK